MTIIARYTPKNIEVEIIDQPYEAGGDLLVPVKATSGKPFAGGDKWPVSTPFATVKAEELEAPRLDPSQGYDKPAGERVTLLSLALAAARDQWSVGQTVTIWGCGEKTAYLANEDGIVNLRMRGNSRPACAVFILDHNTGRWEVARNVERNYRDWTARLQRGY